MSDNPKSAYAEVYPDDPDHTRIVENWVTAGGANSEEDVTFYLRGISTQNLADEIGQSWKFTPHINRDQLVEMVAEYRKNR